MSDNDFCEDELMETEIDELNHSDLEPITDSTFENDSIVDGLSGCNQLKQQSYEVLNLCELIARTRTTTREIMEVLGIPNEASASTLLRHYKWNKEKLIENYTSNAEQVLYEAGVFPELEIDPKSRKKKKYICHVCCESYCGKDTYSLGCGHRYCLSCWVGYLENQFSYGIQSVVNTKCPWPQCNAIVHQVAWEKLTSHAIFAKYQDYASKSLVMDNPLIKFCPAPGCANAILVDFKDRRKAIQCTCKFSWCFRCSDYDVGSHVPATCENVSVWRERASSESENIKWLLVNTKRCPDCHRPIQKNGGCMHMTCSIRSGGCGHQFCWLCRGNWKEHGTDTGGYYSCNKYNSSVAKQEDIKNEEVKTDLEHYMFYYHRFEAHRSAMKSLMIQRDRCSQRINDLVNKFSIPTQDVVFLYEASLQIIDNLRVLHWSYVYGFFLVTKDRDKELYEFLQEDLEKFNEALTRLYEKPILEIADYAEFVQWKSQVANKTRVTKNFLNKFVEGTIKGLTSET